MRLGETTRRVTQSHDEKSEQLGAWPRVANNSPKFNLGKAVSALMCRLAENAGAARPIHGGNVVVLFRTRRARPVCVYRASHRSGRAGALPASSAVHHCLLQPLPHPTRTLQRVGKPVLLSRSSPPTITLTITITLTRALTKTLIPMITIITRITIMIITKLL